ncbi:hypothetical protein Tco_1364523, partial [Tanacetum coccineum]
KATTEDVEVPSNTASIAQHTGSSPKKVGTRRKQFGQKGVHPSHSTIPIEDGDPEAKHKMCIKYASDADYASDDDTPINLHAVIDWELLPTGLGWVNVIYRKDNSRKCFSRLREILHLVTRTDLMIIYGRVMTFYQDKKATRVGLVLWGDHKVLIDSPEVNDGSDVWKNQHIWIIQSWKLYSSTGIHVLETVSGLVVHMFVDTVGNELTTAVQLNAFLKKQISDSRRLKLVVTGFCLLEILVFVLHGSDPFLGANGLTSPRVNGYLVKAHQTHSCSCGGLHVAVKEYAFGFKMLMFNPLVLSKTDLSRNLKYVVPTGRVKVPAGRYVVPTGKDNVIVSAGRTKVIPAGSTILVLVVLCLLRVSVKVIISCRRQGKLHLSGDTLVVEDKRSAEKGGSTKSTDLQQSTVKPDESTVNTCHNKSEQVKQKENEKGVELKNVEDIKRPRPTSIRLVFTLKPLRKIDPKAKGKGMIEEEDESDTESKEITEAEKKFKMLANDEEMAIKV